MKEEEERGAEEDRSIDLTLLLPLSITHANTHSLSK